MALNSGDGAQRQEIAEDPLWADERELWLRLREGDLVQSKVQLVSMYLGLVRGIASTIYGEGDYPYVDFRDLVQLGAIGLFEAMSRFDLDGTASFKAFASKHIRGAILNGLERTSEFQARNAFRRRLRQERVASLIDEAEAGKKQEAFAQMVQVTLGLAIGHMLEGTAMPVVSDANVSSHDEHEQLSSLVDSLHALVEELPEAERDVTRYHYFEGFQFSDIAELLGLSMERISQLHKSALRALRERQLLKGKLSVEI